MMDWCGTQVKAVLMIAYRHKKCVLMRERETSKHGSEGRYKGDINRDR